MNQKEIIFAFKILYTWTYRATLEFCCIIDIQRTLNSGLDLFPNCLVQSSHKLDLGQAVRSAGWSLMTYLY